MFITYWISFTVLLTFAVAGAVNLLSASGVDRKIINGRIALENEYKYVVSVQVNSLHVCGASVISNQWAITAAHCVDEAIEDTITIRAGSKIKYDGIVHQVIKTTKHPLYGTYWYDYDIAMLKVGTPFRRGVTAISLPARHLHLKIGTEVSVAGWGKTNKITELQGTDYLKHVTLNVISNKNCRGKYWLYPVTKNMMCATAKHRDSAEGDSGGPLIFIKNNTHILVGIVSWGEGKGNKSHPGVYTRVSRFLKWIQKEMKEVGTTRIPSTSHYDLYFWNELRQYRLKYHSGIQI